MYANYVTPHNTTLSIDIGSDILEEDICRGTVSVSSFPDGMGKSITRQNLFKDSNGLYIILTGERIYLKDFIFFSYDELKKRLACEVDGERDVHVSNDNILATILRATDEVKVSMTIPDDPWYGITLNPLRKGSKKVTSTLVEHNLPKSRWEYQISLKDENGVLYTILFDDFCEALREGTYSLV